MHVDMVDDFASMLQWLMTALPWIHKTCRFSCRVKSSVISSSAPVAPVSRLHSLGLAVEHATCLQCSQFSVSVAHLPVGSVKLWKEWVVPDFPCPVSFLVHVLPDAMIGILKNRVVLCCHT